MPLGRNSRVVDVDCGNSKVTLHAKRNLFVGDLNAVGFETSLGELKSLTLSVNRVYPKP